MNTSREAYSSTVVNPALVAFGLGLSSLLSIELSRRGAPLGVLVAFVAVATFACAVAGTVRLVIGNGRVIVGQGPFPWPARVIACDDIVALDHGEVTTTQALGIGVGSVRFLTRLTPRSGPALQITLASSERIRVTTPNPDMAARVIQHDTGPLPSSEVAQAPSHRARSHRPWFGPKRAGIGFRPQTWQGWLLTIAATAALLFFLRHR